MLYFAFICISWYQNQWLQIIFIRGRMENISKLNDFQWYVMFVLNNHGWKRSQNITCLFKKGWRGSLLVKRCSRTIVLFLFVLIIVIVNLHDWPMIRQLIQMCCIKYLRWDDPYKVVVSRIDRDTGSIS
jgi:hypothetical protein